MAGRRGRYRVLGIDPGLTRMGYGVVEESGGRLTELAAGTLKSAPADPTPGRLLGLFDRLAELLARFEPDGVAVERVFFKVNARTAVPAMQAAGVALLAAAQAGVEVEEYTPLEVKMAVAGTGTAGKDQVRFMVERLVSSPAGGGPRRGADTTDALAVAVCHLHSRRLRSVQRGAAAGAP
ncbi:MAG: crossover junction endodeoxyribonuclease RuvC [Actinomycetota bacterium]